MKPLKSLFKYTLEPLNPASIPSPGGLERGRV